MTQDEWNKAEDYLEGYMLDLTYDIVTGTKQLKDLINTDQEVILSFDPFDPDIDQVWLLQDLIDWYVETEEYEKCAKLLRMKLKVEKGILDLSPQLYLKDELFIDEEDLAIKEMIKDLLNNDYNKN